MKKTILVAAALCICSMSMKAQDTKEEGFVFTTVKENPITSIKNQNRSSTCWSFSALGFLESELLRMGKGLGEEPVMDGKKWYAAGAGSVCFSRLRIDLKMAGHIAVVWELQDIPRF